MVRDNGDERSHEVEYGQRKCRSKKEGTVRPARPVDEKSQDIRNARESIGLSQSTKTETEDQFIMTFPALRIAVSLQQLTTENP